MTDIDIDFPTNFVLQKIIPTAVRASMVVDNELVKHPCGHYFQTIPVDSVTDLAAIPYKEAELLGYTKIDFLHLALLNDVQSKAQIRQLISKEPDWTMLHDTTIVSQLFQLSN
jgi:hypothetical protein